MKKYIAEVTVRLDVEFEAEDGTDLEREAFEAAAQKCGELSADFDADVHNVTLA